MGGYLFLIVHFLYSQNVSQLYVVLHVKYTYQKNARILP